MRRSPSLGTIVTIAFLVLGFTICLFPVAGALYAWSTPRSQIGNGSMLAVLETFWSLSQKDEIAIIAKRALTVGAISSILSLLCAGFIVRRRRREVLAACFLMPLLIPDALRAFAWGRLLAADGIISQILNHGTIPLQFSDWSLTGSLVFSVVPISTITFVLLLPGAKDTAWFAAEEFGATGWIRFKRLIVQALLPCVPFSFVIGTILTFGASEEERYLGSIKHSTSIEKVASALQNLDGAYLGLLAIMLLIVFAFAVGIALVPFIVYRAGLRWTRTRSLQSIGQIRRYYTEALRWIERKIGKGFDVLQYGISLTTLVVLWFPVPLSIGLGIGVGSGNITATWYWRALQSTSLRWAVINSVMVACAAAILATCAAVFIARLSLRTSTIWCLLPIAWPMLWPADVQAMSFQRALQLFGVPLGNLAAVIVCHAAWLLPFAIATISIAYRNVPEQMLRVGREFGYGEDQLFSRIILPLSRPGIVTACAIGLLFSLTESRRGWHLGGPYPLLSQKVFGGLQSGIVGDGRAVYAMASIVLMFVISSTVMLLWLNKKSRTWRIG